MFIPSLVLMLIISIPFMMKMESKQIGDYMFLLIAYGLEHMLITLQMVQK